MKIILMQLFLPENFIIILIYYSAKDSLYYDAFMSKGLFNFAISQAPQTWSWALNLAGMTGNKKTGLDYLEVASKKGKFSKIMHSFIFHKFILDFLLKYQPATKY